MRCAASSKLARLVEDERQRAEQLGALAQLCRDDFRVGSSAGDRAQLRRFPHRLEQQVAGCPEGAADRYPLRVEEVEERRRGRADVPAGLGQRAGAGEVAAACAGDDLVEVERLAERPLEHADERLRRGHRLQAAAVSAAADVAVLLNRDVADLAGGPARAAQHLAVCDQARADARRDLQVHERRGAAAGAPERLGARPEIRVVVHVDRELEPVLDVLKHPHALPSGEDRRRADRPGARMERPGEADPDAERVGPRRARLGERRVDERDRGREPHVRAVVLLHLLPALREHAVSHVAHGDGEVALAEVHADRHADAGVQRDHRGGPPAARPGAVRIGVHADEPFLLELRDDRGDGRRREAGSAGNLGAARGPQHRQLSHDPGPVRIAPMPEAGHSADHAQNPVGLSITEQTRRTTCPRQGRASFAFALSHFARRQRA
jgi:hypothetical protein